MNLKERLENTYENMPASMLAATLRGRTFAISALQLVVLHVELSQSLIFNIVTNTYNFLFIYFLSVTVFYRWMR